MFSNICTAHAQKRLFMHFRYKLRHRRSIRRPRFPVRVQNFSDLATFSVDFCILYAEPPPNFYFRFLLTYWPRKYTTRVYPTSIIPTKFEALTPIRSWVMSDNVSHWLPLKMRTRPLRMRVNFLCVTLTFDLLTLNSCHSWRVTWPISPPSMKTLRLSILELRVITVPID